MLYVELRKALYGTLKAALLFWKRLTKELKKWGFKINAYDSCVMNKIIDGKQCTILWHVDNLKISHANPNVVTNVNKMLKHEFGVEAPLTKTRGKIHDYLGMTLDFSTCGKVKIGMSDYIDKMLDEFLPNMDGESATPAANHLFDVHPDTENMLLDRTDADFFHTNVAKLLFLCKQARPDIQTAVLFLCTRVKKLDKDDYKKLTRVMQYLCGTREMVLTLEASDLQIIKWWIDASFAVHPDMKGHTGGALILGKGAIYGTAGARPKVSSSECTT